MLETILAYILLLFGIGLTIKLKFYSPLRVTRLALNALKRESAGCRAKDDGISPIAGLFTALAGSIGTGNVTGVCGAIIIGGPGAVFWMWVGAFFSFALKYSEVNLSILFKSHASSVSRPVSGPMAYINNGLGKRMRPLAAVFAALCALTSFGIGNAVQSNAVADTVTAHLSSSANIGGSTQLWIRLGLGILMALALAYAMSGGAKRISKASIIIIPIVGAVYIICSIIVIGANAERIGSAFSSIFSNAFGLKPVLGGTAGTAMAHAMTIGISRGTFSNEAGMGSSPIAHAASTSIDPKKQGALGIIEVFADTIIICTMTALVLLTSTNAIPYGDMNASYMAVVQSAFANILSNGFAGIMLSSIMPLFAFASMLAWSYYGRVSTEYLMGSRASVCYLILFCAVAALGACIPLYTLWKAASIMNLLMAVPNLIALSLLSWRVK